MAKQRKKQSPHDKILINFCNKPATTLAGFKAATPITFIHENKNYKIVPIGLLPKGIELPQTGNLNTLSISAVTSRNKSTRSVKLNIGQVIKEIKNLKHDQASLIDSAHGQFAIVHESVDLIKPNVSPTTDMAEENSRRRRKPVPKTDHPAPTQEPITSPVTEISALKNTKATTNDNVPEVDVDALEVDLTTKAELSNFQTYKWSAFLSETMNKEYVITAKDHVINKKGIAVIEYAGRKKPIGFMLPDGLIRGNGIGVNGRYPVSHAAQIIKNKWAAEPLKPAVITIANMRGAPMVLVTMGAALELRKKGLFDKAPPWVHDHLNVAQADINAEQKKRVGLEGIDTTKPAAVKPAPVKPKPTKTPPLEPTAEKIVVPEPAPTTLTEPETPKIQVENAMAAVAKALATAKQTQALVKVEIANANGQDMVHVGADEESIQAMENVISLAETMGAEAPEVTRLDYKPTSMAESLSAIKMAWETSKNDNSLIILEPESGQRIAMTKNPELLQAYALRF